MLIEFTIKILLIIFDSLIFAGMILLCIFFIFDYDHYFLSTFLRILIPSALLTKLLFWIKLRKKNGRLGKSLIVRRFMAIILAYIVPIHILWNTQILYINKDVLDIIYILMLIFFIFGVLIERRMLINSSGTN